MTDFDHFTRLGLTSNPFRTLSREEWGQIAFLTPEIERIIQQEIAHLQLTGRIGRGKTTTLMGIQAICRSQNQQVVYEYIPIGQRHFKTHFDHAGPDVFLLDEAQRLWQHEKFRLLRLCQKNPTMRLIFSSHADLSGWFRHRNLAIITYDVDELPRTSLADLLHKRLTFFQSDADLPLRFTPEAIAYLEITFGSNRRQMEQFLYEVFELVREPRPLTAEFLADCQQQLHRAEQQGIQSTQIKRQTFRTWSRHE